MNYNYCFMIIIHTMSLSLIEILEVMYRTELIIDIGQTTVIDIFRKKRGLF